MRSDKKATFIKRAKFAKGGAVRRYFDLGGPTQLTSSSGTQSSGMLSPGGTLTNAGTALGVSPDSGFGQALGAANTLNPLNTQDQFRATGAPIQAGTNAAQLNTAYGQAQSGLQQQQDFYNQLQQQNGVNNQSQVYGQLQDIAAGRGPNPAQAMLNQETGQNVSNQAALMAGQRGASSNAGLIARQAAQQGAATQQQAVGQGATNEAQQRMGAINAAGNIAGQQVNQQGQALTGYNTGAQNEQNILQGANSNFNNAQVGMQSNLNNVNGQISQGNQAANNAMLSGVMNGAAAKSMLGGLLAKGGIVGVDGRRVSALTIRPGSYTHHYDDGGSVDFGDQGYSAPEASSSPAIGSMAATDEAAPFKQSGGGGGGGGLAMLALLADGGEVNFGTPGYTAPTSVSAPNIGAMSSTDEAAAFQQGQKEQSKKGQQQPQPKQGQPNVISPDQKAALKEIQGLIVHKVTDPRTGIGTLGPVSANPGEVDLPGVQSGYPSAGSGDNDTPIYAARGGRMFPGPYKSHVANFLAAGGKVPAMVSPGEVSLSPEAVRKVVEEGANPLKIGEHFKGKAKVKGDSLRNDVLPRTLEAGGVIIPRHVVNTKSIEKAKLFVHEALAKKRNS